MSTLDTGTPEAPFGFKADGTPRKRPRPSDEVIQRSIATRRANGTKRKRNGHAPVITAADERAFSGGFDLDGTIEQIRGLAASSQEQVTSLREQLAEAEAECERLTAAAVALAEV